ncbi:MAG TPA: hypothetical protein VGR36_05970 [Candidatus Acidoferrales bacterium]|nr:hypothetical protein [Candidatus Acidoferrales bacterium]
MHATRFPGQPFCQGKARISQTAAEASGGHGSDAGKPPCGWLRTAGSIGTFTMATISWAEIIAIAGTGKRTSNPLSAAIRRLKGRRIALD